MKTFLLFLLSLELISFTFASPCSFNPGNNSCTCSSVGKSFVATWSSKSICDLNTFKNYCSSGDEFKIKSCKKTGGGNAGTVNTGIGGLNKKDDR